MVRGAAVLLFLLASCVSSSAQDTAKSYVLDRIILEGNKTTKDFVILRELPFRPGDTVSAREIEYGRERVYSTGLFTKVMVQTEPVSATHADLLIYVEERWYIWPYPVIGFQDRDFSRFYAGAGILHMNFMGREEKLGAMFALGYDPFGSIMYYNPSLGRGDEYILSMGASYSRGRNAGDPLGLSSGEFNDSFGNLYVDIGRRYGVYNTITLGTAYNYISRNTDTTGLVLSPTGSDVFASLTLSYVYDSRDLKTYASQGMYLFASLQKFGLGESIVNFGRLSIDLRNYTSLAAFLILATRVHGDFSEGPEIPPYNRVFIGYNERIRGMFNTVSEGESMVGANVELRIPIIRKMYIEIPEIPLREFVSNRIALYWSFFADAGETTPKRVHLLADRALYGYGGGLSLLLPYDVILQADYARGRDKHWEFIFDIGATI